MHRAVFNKHQSRIEMHLVSMDHQTVNISGQDIYFNKGEIIHTQSAYKYNFMQFKRLLSDAGWKCDKNWVDDKQWFNLQLASC